MAQVVPFRKGSSGPFGAPPHDLVGAAAICTRPVVILITMRWFFCLVAAVAVAAESAHDAGTVSGTISVAKKWKEQLKGRNWLIDAKVHIDGGLYSAFPDHDGSFVIPNVPKGSHLLQVVHPELKFDPVQLEITGRGKVAAFLLDWTKGRGAKLNFPLGLAPSEQFDYYKQREEFDMFAQLKSPMTLFMMFMFGMMFIMPKIQPDEEQMKQLKQEGGFAAQFLGGTGDDDDEPGLNMRAAPKPKASPARAP